MTDFLKRIEKDDGVFCILPFTHLYIHSSEKPRVCCTYEQYSLNDQPNTVLDMENIWSSDYYKNIRKSVLDGKKLKGCYRCYNSEKNGGNSDRLVYTEKYKNLVEKNKIDNLELNIETGTQHKTPLDLDLRPDNLCNLQCRMCGPSSSTQLNKEFSKMPKSWGMTTYREELKSDWASDKNFEFILKNVDKGKRIKFLGGEPTLMPEVFNILDILLKSGKSDDVELHFTSNLTNANQKFLDTISKFKHVNISISMDGVGKTLEYIRYPIKWNQIQKNIETYSSISGIAPYNKFDIQFTVQAYNIHNILDTVRWMKSVNDSDSLNGKRLLFSPEILYYPKYFKYTNLPKLYRDRHINRVLLNPIINENFISDLNLTKSKLETMLHDKTEEDPYYFIKHTVYYDISRNQCMKDYLPELWTWFEKDYTTLRKNIEREQNK